MKRILSLCTAALLLVALAACQKEEAGDLLLGDFSPFYNGKATQMPGTYFHIDANTTVDYGTRRGIQIGDNAKALAAEYNTNLCDISYDDGAGFTTLNQTSMEAFIKEAQPRYFTVSYMMLSTGGEIYRINQLDEAPDNGEYTFYYLEFEVTDDLVTGITFNIVHSE